MEWNGMEWYLLLSSLQSKWRASAARRKPAPRVDRFHSISLLSALCSILCSRIAWTARVD
jgi:hypothetical protein